MWGEGSTLCKSQAQGLGVGVQVMHSWVGTLTCGVGSHGAGPLGASLLFCQCCPDLFRHRFPLQGVKAQHPQVSSFLQHQEGLYFF